MDAKRKNKMVKVLKKEEATAAFVDSDDDDDGGEYDLCPQEEGDDNRNSGSKKKKGSSGGSGLRSCQVDKCAADLSDAKQYHRRHKVCEVHAKAQVVLMGGMRQRFCQQCSRFQLPLCSVSCHFHLTIYIYIGKNCSCSSGCCFQFPITCILCMR